MSNCFIIAELGVNFRNLNEADKMIKECAEAGVDAVKFQMYKPMDYAQPVYHTPDDPKLPPGFDSKDVYEWISKVWRGDEIASIALTEEDVRYLYWRCRAHGVEFMCTPFYPEAIDVLNPYVKRWKIRFKDNRNYLLLDQCMNTKKEILISQNEKCARYNDPIFKFLYCVPEYPPKDDWDIINKGKGFDGFSSHYPYYQDVWLMVANNGYKYLEVHVKRDNYDPPYCPIDNSVSITMTELKELVERIRAI